MSQNILRTPRVLTGFDVKKDTIVFSRIHKEKELCKASNGKIRKLCRGYLPVFANNDIIYVYEKNGDKSDIFMYKNGVQALTKKGRNLAPQPCPDGNKIAFLSDRNGSLSLCVMDLTKYEPKCVFTPEDTYLRSGVWSPGGNFLVYWTRKTPVKGSGIWKIDVRTHQAEQIVYFPECLARVGSPYVWYLSASSTPDYVKKNIWVNDNQVIFISDKKGYDTFGILDMDKSADIEWITGDTYSKEFYEVSPNGKWIAYNAYKDGTTSLVFLGIENGSRREVETNGCLSHPVWYKNGVYCHKSSFEGTGIVYVPLDGVIKHYYQEKSSFSTCKPVPVHYTSFDGRSIGGWLYNEDIQKVLVWLHGGPADVCLNNFDPVIQYFALNNYAVFASNFRGSTGYGKEFEKLNWNDLGGGDLQDVIEGISYLKQKGYGSFVVGGQSYGAYLSLMVLTQYPDVCEGGFCISGVYNLLPEYGSDWLMNSGCVWMDLDDRGLLLERSPACHIDDLKNPVFFIHGAKDKYTPLSGLQYTLKKAKEAGTNDLVKVTIYQNEGHGISNQENIEEVYPNIVKFLNNITKKS